MTSSDDLSISGVVTGTGGVTLVSGSNLTIGSSGQVVAGNNTNAILSAVGNFINSRSTGSTAILVSGTGRWLVYSAGPDNDVFNGLNSGNTAIWNTTYPTAVAASGNHYVFAYQPTLVVTSTGTLTKTYGDDATAAVAASSFTTAGLQGGVSNAFLGDSLIGTPAFTSTGAGTAADASVIPYSIVGAVGGLAMPGYAYSFVNNGTLTVNAATLLATANTAWREYGDGNPTLSG